MSSLYSLKMWHFLLKKTIYLLIAFLFSMSYPFNVVAQNHPVSGKVTDHEGKALSGATVTVKNMQNGTSTDAEGRFSINVPNANGTLVFTFVGFTTQEVPLNNRSIIDLSMTNAGTSLQDVVVVGYGVQQKRSLTGAVATVKEEQLRAVPTGDPASRLQGRAAGVTVTNNNAPGAAATVRVRAMAPWAITIHCTLLTVYPERVWTT